MDGAEKNTPGNRFGIHRVLDKEPRLPQAAERLDNSLPIYSNEILIDVQRLNIDAASFIQMDDEAGGDAAAIGEIILRNCRELGKQQNRVTGSGGMLTGTVREVGSQYRGILKLKRGQRVATLVSLTLTPMQIEKILCVHSETHQIEVKGHAILFESGTAVTLPDDFPESVAISVCDVAGAPALVNGLCRKAKTLVVVGAGGKAGALCCVAGRKRVQKSGRVIAIEPNASACRDLRSLGVCTEVLQLDATDPIAVCSGVERVTHGKMGDIVINVASVPNTEMSSILSAQERGKVVFFSMTTSFPRVALGAEGVATRATLIFGNGYYPHHTTFAFDLLRTHLPLKNLFYRRYGR